MSDWIGGSLKKEELGNTGIYLQPTKLSLDKMNELFRSLFYGEECKAQNQAWITTLNLQGSFYWTGQSTSKLSLDRSLNL
jgi:hypothetical protein